MLKKNNEERSRGDFLPDLCSVQSVFLLILIGELLAFAIVIVDHGLFNFDWLSLGTVSFLVQWVVLSSAAIICRLRPWFKHQNGFIAGAVSFSIVLFFTAFFTSFGHWVETQERVTAEILFGNLIVAAILAGSMLRYFYLQQALQNRKQVELQARIQALQSRIRPHFLFNSMNSIASLIDIDPKAAEKMVVDLSQLFRSSLKEPGLIPITDEIALCETFISIEKARLGPRLTIAWDIDLQNKTPLIPSLLIQPLIENAIYHGIQPLPKGGTVNISIRVVEQEVVVCISNPLSTNTVDAKLHKGNGVALDNIQHRLDAYYGKEAKIKITTSEHYVIQIQYPIKTDLL